MRRSRRGRRPVSDAARRRSPTSTVRWTSVRRGSLKLPRASACWSRRPGVLDHSEARCCRQRQLASGAAADGRLTSDRVANRSASATAARPRSPPGERRALASRAFDRALQPGPPDRRLATSASPEHDRRALRRVIAPRRTPQTPDAELLGSPPKIDLDHGRTPLARYAARHRATEYGFPVPRGQSAIWDPIVTVRSLGSPKCSMGLAAFRAIAMNSPLRQARSGRAEVGVMVMRDTK